MTSVLCVFVSLHVILQSFQGENLSVNGKHHLSG